MNHRISIRKITLGIMTVGAAALLAGCSGVTIGGGYAGGFGGHSGGFGGAGVSLDLGTLLNLGKGEALPALRAGKAELSDLRIKKSDGVWKLTGTAANAADAAQSVTVSVPCEAQSVTAAETIVFRLTVQPGAKAQALNATAPGVSDVCRPDASRAAAEAN